MRTASLLVVFGFTGTLLACGQKGPLVLPDAQHPHKKIGLPNGTPKPPPQSASPPAGTSGAAPSSIPAPTGAASSGEPDSHPALPQ